eukprot:7670463-Pyramimonas_sp.AAC.1
MITPAYAAGRRSGAGSDPRWQDNTIGEMYPGLAGNELQSSVFQDYLLDPANPTCRMAFFDSNNQPIFTRHKLNNRNFAAHRENLVRRILKQGLMEGVRGEAWAVPEKPDTTMGNLSDSRMMLLSHATLTEAVYEAHRRKPSNRYVKTTLQLGLQIKVFQGRTPKYICEYLKEIHNEFHSGAQTSFLEKYDNAKETEIDWAKHCKSKGIQARSLPTKGPNTYRKTYWKWMVETR